MMERARRSGCDTNQIRKQKIGGTQRFTLWPSSISLTPSPKGSPVFKIDPQLGSLPLKALHSCVCACIYACLGTGDVGVSQLNHAPSIEIEAS